MNIDLVAEISDFPRDLDAQATQVVDALRKYRADDNDLESNIAKLRVIVLATQIACTAIKDLSKKESPPGAKIIKANVMTADGLVQIDVPVQSDGKTPIGLPFDHRMPLLEAVNQYLDELDLDGTLRIHEDGVTFLPIDSCAVSLMEDEDHLPVCHECNANGGECDCDESLNNDQNTDADICIGCEESPIADGEDYCRDCIAAAELANSSVECFICKDVFRHEKMLWESAHTWNIEPYDHEDDIPLCGLCSDDIIDKMSG